MKMTGIKASPEALAKIKAEIHRPVIFISGGHRIGGEQTPQQVCHAEALKAGLPEITGYYGITQDGEFCEV